MNKRNQKTLLSAATIIRGLDNSSSRWLCETADSVEQIANSLETLERMKTGMSRRPRAAKVIPAIQRKTSQEFSYETYTPVLLDKIV